MKRRFVSTFQTGRVRCVRGWWETFFAQLGRLNISPLVFPTRVQTTLPVVFRGRDARAAMDGRDDVGLLSEITASLAGMRLSIVGAKIGQPGVPVIGFAGDGAFGIAVNELTAIGRDEWPAITQIVFRNYQWGAEKRNSTLWFDDNFVGTELDEDVSYAGIANACGLKGVVARTQDELTEALAQAIKDQMENGVTTLIEAMINQELGDPFRRDAMKKPVAVAGISKDDMRPQAV